ncbi:MAG: UvrB/UvrC motif-containing protein [Candidatus Omnitrophica bacterium]|nr:UvrB/UvrC motif-containing protein [Candidatus Omnitrophota bacterium]
MLCDICGKNDATVHLTEIVDNKMTKLHLCEECAKKKGAEMEEHFGLSDLLAGLVDFETKVTHKKELKKKCARCGMTYEDFRRTGRLGCGECYATFEESLVPLIKRVHGSSEHLGKVPSRVSKPVKVQASQKKIDGLEELKRRLQRAVKLEQFEDAARLRDKIRELEKKK